MAELKKLQQRRLKVTFVDDDADDNSTRAMQRQIEGLTGDITEVSLFLSSYKLVRASEVKLKELMKFDDSSRFDEQSKSLMRDL